MAIEATVQEIEKPLTAAAEEAMHPDDLAKTHHDAEQARRDSDEAIKHSADDALEKIRIYIDFAIAEIEANPNIAPDRKAELTNNLRSLKLGLAVNPNLALVQKEISDARATATFEGTTNALYESLSLTSQAAVNERLFALEHGRVADYYFSVADPDHLYSADSRKHLAAIIEADPENKQLAHTMQGFSKQQKRASLVEIASRDEWLNEQTKNAHDPELKRLLMMARNAHITHSRSGGEAFMNAVNSGDMAAANAAIEHQIEKTAKGLEKRIQPGTEAYLHLKHNPDFLAADGHAVDFVKVERFALLHAQEMADAANLRDDPHRKTPLTPEQEMLADLSDIHNLASFSRMQKDDILLTTHNIAKQNPQAFETILDKSIPAATRAHQLEGLLNQEANSKNNAQRARELIALFDKEPDAYKDILEKDGKGDLKKYRTELRQLRIAQGLDDLGFNAADVTKLNKLAEASPELKQLMNNSFSGSEGRILTPEKQKTFFSNIVADGGPDASSKEAVSIIKYYNLMDSYEGSQLRKNIYLGEVSPNDALAQAHALQQEAIARMHAFSSIVPDMVKDHPEYTQRLQAAQMYNEDGTLNVEKLVEAARMNRDRHDAEKANGIMSDKELAAISQKDFDQLTEAQKNERVIARTAAHFKAIDAIQTFGSEVNNAYARIDRDESKASDALKKDLDFYRKLMGNSGQQEQEKAVEALLSRQQYFKTTPELMADVKEEIVELTQKNPDLLQSYAFSSATKAASPIRLEEVPPFFDLPAGLAQPNPPFTPSEIAALNREASRNSGDDIFENRMENRIKKALKGVDMGQIVATFGKLVAQPDDPKTPGVKNNQNFISTNELENALMAVQILDPQTGKKLTDDQVFKLVDQNNDGQLTAIEMVDYLKQNGQLAAVAGGVPAAVAAATTAAPSVPQAPSVPGAPVSAPASR